MDVDDDVKREILGIYSISIFLIRIFELRTDNEESTTLTSLEMITMLNNNLQSRSDNDCSLNLSLKHQALRYGLTVGTAVIESLRQRGITKVLNKRGKKNPSCNLFPEINEGDWKIDWNQVKAFVDKGTIMPRTSRSSILQPQVERSTINNTSVSTINNTSV
jgi:hypothetical protein